ncbi:formate--tetrahydrofolate ligase [Corynebacterium sp. 320]|uniref:formate--tetrahydrofolate ligase n=1 Tax=Corynebacterium TaxID=1716 RepID=UPI00125CBB33|nr:MULTISPECIES: formate--tetrahydrofolate ligase [Corynebacterium]KAB1503583.1 formate--tetrahydrofolate ligase [Corynebacterium sp. 320]KAB1553316.1 formate--tetrahydrofolate ligase [Corynebacterium sp. 321]KAB3527719.1 formate--tetrahydrofolate ligase [Corynebacterium sp. 250]QNP92940.1 formate--tetrahydrofolate ligase [Corynebacterium zhongnanshanii]
MSNTDVEIAQAHTLEPIHTIAERGGIPEQALVPFGTTKAKIDVTALPEDASATGQLVLVTGMSPTPAGEGKSTVLIGLADAIASRRSTFVAIREPSLGPVMGIKGGAAGGGYAQIVPMEDINLHFTGDLHAITSATNTLAALVDNHIQHGNALGIDPRRVTWRRCLDVNDRSLRNIVTGLGGPVQGTPREAGFDITAASEIMAVLCLATDLADLKERLARIVVGQTYDRKPVTAGELNAQGALASLLRDAINPNLVQTLGGTPALVHGGPFANIAHGCNSLIATTTALKLADVVLTEAGFGSDLGAEKFFDVKARAGDLSVGAAVVVATIRSLKYNGGKPKDQLTSEDLPALRDGLANLERHVENVRKFNVEPVVALNVFSSDTDEELTLVEQWAKNFGVRIARTTVWANGGDGATELADEVLEVLDAGGSSAQQAESSQHQLYDPSLGVEESIRTIATTIYGARDVEFSSAAMKDLAFLKDNGWDQLPVVISKTQYSFSDDPSQLGAASGHTLHVRQLLPRIGAGFIVALTGDVMTLPGLPKKPAAEGIDVDAHGTISGLF